MFCDVSQGSGIEITQIISHHKTWEILYVSSVLNMRVHIHIRARALPQRPFTSVSSTLLLLFEDFETYFSNSEQYHLRREYICFARDHSLKYM
jgi:hypothetical protein